MSMIAALLAQAANAETPGVTAAQVMAAHRAATSIGRDPCRPGVAATGGNDEIVVCGRRESPYALPLYEPPSAGEGLMSGMDRELAVGIAQDTAASCHARGEPCIKPLPMIGVPVGPGKKGGVRIGRE